MLVRKMLCVGLLALPIMAKADLTVVNNTNQDSTSVINDGACSTILPGGIGTTKAHSTSVVPQHWVAIACLANQTSCKADVYMTGNCSGPKVATVIFNTKTGIQSVSPATDGYVLSGSGFSISISGGPAKK